MRRLPALLAGAGLVCAAVATGSAPVAHAGGGVVLLRDHEAGRWRYGATDDLVQPDTTTEPSIAVNPANPRNVVVGYQEGRVDGGGDATNGYATTLDGGQTWTFGEVPKLTKWTEGIAFDRASDAVVAFGPGNTVYYSSLVFDDGSGAGGGDTLRSAIVNSTSHDGGLTWDDPTTVIDDMAGGLNDKNWLTVDNGTGTGHHTGRVYVTWDRLAPALVSYSDDQGKTWSPPSVLYSGQGIGTYPLVMPNGDLAVVFATDVEPLPPVHGNPNEDLGEPITGVSRLVLALSPGAGLVVSPAPLVFAPPVAAATYEGHEPRVQRASGGLPTAAVDPKNGRIYVGWDDSRYRTETNSPVNDSVVVWSDDEGATWTSPKRINPGPTDDWVNRFNSMIGVSDDGVLHVAYRQRQEAADTDAMSNFVDTYYQESSDGGATFSAPLKVNTVRADARFAAFSRNGAFWGDYNQLAVGGGFTYVVRCESYTTDPRDTFDFPPDVHHQRTWVAVVGPASSSTGPVVVPAKKPPGTKTTTPPAVSGSHLPATGGGAAGYAAGAALLLLAAVSSRVRRRA